MPRNARWAARTGLRVLGIGTVAAGVVLGPVALPALTPPAGAESTGTIALTPGSGSITDDPFAGFVADAPCPTGYDTLAQLTLEVDGVPVPLASLEGTGLDEIPPSGTVDGSLAAIANEVGGIVDLPDGVFPLLLTCFDAEFNTAPDPFRSAIRITDDTWSVAETVDPTPTGTGSPTPTQSPGPTPTPTSTGSPTPTESPSPSPSDSPTPTPTPTPSDDPSPTPTETPSPTPDPGGGTLPKTGTDLLTFVYVGLALIAAGIAALLWARRLGLLTRDAPDASTP